MTMMRRCDVQSCAAVKTDDPAGVSGFTSFTMDGRGYDICPGCRNTFKAWMDGVAVITLVDVRTEERVSK